MHLDYRNLIVNFKKIINIKSIKDSISKKLCEFYLFDRQQVERSRVFKTKAKKFLKKINVDIKIDFSIISRDNKYFVLIKDDK